MSKLTEITSAAYQTTKHAATILALAGAVACEGKPVQPTCEPGETVAVKTRPQGYTIFDCNGGTSKTGIPAQFISYTNLGSSREIDVRVKPESTLGNYTLAQLDSIYAANVR